LTESNAAASWQVSSGSESDAADLDGEAGFMVVSRVGSPAVGERLGLYLMSQPRGWR
jgi:hypothetical protein